MTETPKKIIVDCSTGEQTIEDFTAEEIAELEESRALAEAERLAEAEAQAELEATKQAAHDKLAALGLTAEEIAAITK